MRIPSTLEIDYISVYPLNPEKLEMGWEAYSYLKGMNEIPYGGGYASTEELAQVIAVAESLERHLFERKISKSDSYEFDAWGLNINKTTSGFAFGSSPEAVTRRSLFEAYEHFVRYHGVYRGLVVDNYKTTNEETSIVDYLSTYFDKVNYFYRTDQFNINSEILTLHCVITLALKSDGIFIGAKCSTEQNSLMKLSLIESLRNLKLFENYLNKKSKSSFKNDTEIRNYNAGNGAESILRHINSSTEKWPTPEILLMKIEKNLDCDGYLGRTLMKELPPWYDLSTNKLI